MLKLYVNQELNHIKPLLGSEDSLMVGDRIALPQNISKKSGQLYTWGRGSEGQLGQNAYRYPPNCCALPRPVKGLHNIIQVSCGGGVQGCTAAITITGKVFTFGNNFKGRLGYTCKKDENTSLPRQVESISDSHATYVACGQGHMICLTSKGKLYSWGTDTDGCLGHDHHSKKYHVNNNEKKNSSSINNKKKYVTQMKNNYNNNNNNDKMTMKRKRKKKGGETNRMNKNSRKKIIVPPKYVHDLEFGLSSTHSLHPSSNTFNKYRYNVKKKNNNDDNDDAITTALIVYDKNNINNHDYYDNEYHTYLSNVIAIDACGNVSAAILKDGRLCLWGRNKSGELGNGDYVNRSLPTLVKNLEDVRQISVGSKYCGAVTNSGEVYMWGYGGSGNLGLGNRKSYNTPQRVLGLIGNEHTKLIACSKNQDCGVTMGYHGTKPNPGGHEGPHTVALTIYGEVYTWGTAYSGALGNIGKKTKGLGQNWDELLPYKLGSPVHNDSKKRKNAPISPYAVWPTPYDKMGPFVAVNASNSRTTLISQNGRAYVFGNGGNDGRAGVERFLTKVGSQTRRQIDRDSCILTQPHQIGQFREKYWKGGPGFRDISVLSIAMGTTHSAAICIPDDDSINNKTHPTLLPSFDEDTDDQSTFLIENDYIIDEKIPWKDIAHRSPKNLPNAKRDEVYRKEDDWWRLELKLNVNKKKTDETIIITSSSYSEEPAGGGK